MVPTRFIMVASSVCLAVSGLALLFAPTESLGLVGISETNPFTGQLLGAAFLGNAVANWTARGSMIGGIYARPLSLANYVHFVVGGISLMVGLAQGKGGAGYIAVLFVYSVFGALFSLMLFGGRGRKRSSNEAQQ